MKLKYTYWITMLFKCDECHLIENTGTSNYKLREAGDPKLCAECDPSIGKHHNRFTKNKCDDYYIDNSGYARSSKEILTLPSFVKIVGKYNPDGTIEAV